MSAIDPGPVVQRILLGAELRDARETAGLSTTEATRALGWYAGKLSKIEQGDAKVTDKDLAKAVKVYGIVDDRAGRLQQLATDSRRRLPPARVPEWAVKYVNLMAAAREVKIFNIDCFPGTVQTAEYAHAMLSEAVMFSPAERERMSEERASRTDRFRGPDNPPRLWLVLDEAALHRQVGGKRVLLGQLEKVRELASLPNVTVQVIPFDGGAHASHGVAFSIVNLFEGKPGIVYVESLTGSDYLGREHTRAYNLAYDKLRVAALSERRTIELIDRRIAEL